MSKLAEDGLRAGACGISTSRTILHSSQHGLVPGTDAPPEELLALGEAIGRAGHGVFQLVSDHQGGAGDRAWLVDLVERTGATATYALAQAPYARDAWRDALAASAEDRAAGRRIIPQVACRPTGMLFGLQSSLHPFFTHPTYRALADLPLAERVARLSQPEVRAALLADEPGTKNPIALGLMQRWDQIFPLGDPPDYEPPRSASIAGVAEREGRSPQEVALDWLLERDGTAFLFAPLASYVDHDHEALREMMTDPNTVLGLSDGGAHCGLICDVSMPTYLLTHWVNGRERGPAPRPRAGHQPADVAHRRGLRLHRSRRDRRGQARRPQPHRPRRHAPAGARRWCSTSPPAAAASSSAPTATSPRSSPARSPWSTASPPAPAPVASSASEFPTPASS